MYSLYINVLKQQEITKSVRDQHATHLDRVYYFTLIYFLAQ